MSTLNIYKSVTAFQWLSSFFEAVIDCDFDTPRIVICLTLRTLYADIIVILVELCTRHFICNKSQVLCELYQVRSKYEYAAAISECCDDIGMNSCSIHPTFHLVFR